MRLGDILVAQGIVTPRDVTEAMELQKTQGGRLGDVLIAAGKLKAIDLEAVMLEAPPIPSSRSMGRCTPTRRSTLPIATACSPMRASRARLMASATRKRPLGWDRVGSQLFHSASDPGRPSALL